MTQFNNILPIVPVELHKTKKIPPAGKEYRSSHATQCVKSRIMNKATDCILSIGAFEQQCVVIKGILQSPRLEYYMKTIHIYQSLCNRSSFNTIFLIT